VNIVIWDSVLMYENFSFRGAMSSVNPRNPFARNEDCFNYEQDSEDELEELLGHDANSQIDAEEEEYDSEYPRGWQLTGSGDDLELVNEGWLVPDDYLSSDSSVTRYDDENEAEHELRRQQKRIEREQKQVRHAYQKRIDERIKAAFSLGKQMKPTIDLDGRSDLTEYQVVSLLQSSSTLEMQ